VPFRKRQRLNRHDCILVPVSHLRIYKVDACRAHGPQPIGARRPVTPIHLPIDLGRGIDGGAEPGRLMGVQALGREAEDICGGAAVVIATGAERALNRRRQEIHTRGKNE